MWSSSAVIIPDRIWSWARVFNLKINLQVVRFLPLLQTTNSRSQVCAEEWASFQSRINSGKFITVGPFRKVHIRAWESLFSKVDLSFNLLQSICTISSPPCSTSSKDRLWFLKIKCQDAKFTFFACLKKFGSVSGNFRLKILFDHVGDE